MPVKVGTSEGVAIFRFGPAGEIVEQQTRPRSRPMTSWDAYWSELRRRRAFAAIALAAFPLIWIFGGSVGLLVGFLALFGSYWWLRQWRCPRCRLPVVGVGFATFPERCQPCGLPLFGHPDDVMAPVGARENALRLSRRLRRFVAGVEIAAGAAAMTLVAFSRGVPLWYAITLEGLGGLSLGAGLWLWQGRERGYALSRAVLLAQLIRIESPWLVYAATAGFFVDLYHTGSRIGLNPGFYAALGLAFGPGLPLAIAVNLWAAVLLLMLMHARPEIPDPPPMPALPALDAGNEVVSPAAPASSG